MSPPIRTTRRNHKRGRSPGAVPAKGRVTKKTSTTTTMTSPRRSGAAVMTEAAARSPPRDCDLALPASPRPSPAASVAFKKGEYVGVRTYVGTLPPKGQPLVLWLGAVVISADGNDGHLEVKYNGNFPRDDPSRTVRVAITDVRKRPDAPSNSAMAATTVNNAAPRPSGGDNATQRPTVAGKSLPLLKKLETEMRESAKAFLAHGSSSRRN
ncbi:hypothetical protein GUJ93_ZPchr0007g4819 [Zizania palustris]|uniref:Uncharacterized protein n=1 Tax=Zizania palustris TaxID=103762 RepID=A0A8J5TD53_ZIZPA|nr:hypothetical protein GUJ93_ZPchr0007g6188 [Zizania palustris]KAG8080335.1 hypothetical protein GUJ93_ZPchr0007g4819 [Zizania palustris]